VRRSALAYLGFLASPISQEQRTKRSLSRSCAGTATGDADSTLAALVRRSAFLAGNVGIHRLAYRRLSAPQIAMCKIVLLTNFPYGCRYFDGLVTRHNGCTSGEWGMARVSEPAAHTDAAGHTPGAWWICFVAAKSCSAKPGALVSRLKLLTVANEVAPI
jgi:hypothetical protein